MNINPKHGIPNPEMKRENISEVNEADLLASFMTESGSEDDLNIRIMEVTKFIKEQYPELSGLLEEAPNTLPNENNPALSFESQREYHESLVALLVDHISKQPK